MVALTGTEVVALIRDIVLIIFFVLGVLALALGIGLGLGFYRRTSRLMNRVDAGVDKVEAMVDSVESTASTVGKTATSMNRGMKAGGFARTAVNTVFGRNND